MASTSYKQWSPADRDRSYKLTTAAQKKGLIPYPTCCNRCTQTQGLIQSHNEDYGFTLEVLPDIISGAVIPDEDMLMKLYVCLEQLCWRCHQMWHSQRRDPPACKIYWDQIKAGVIFPPVYKHDFSILIRENGVGYGGICFLRN